MAQQVIKRDGTKQAFDESKLRKSIEMAAREAGLADDRVNAVVGQVAGAALQMATGKEEIATSELRTFILGRLDEVEPAAAAAWRKHDEGRGKT